LAAPSKSVYISIKITLNYQYKSVFFGTALTVKDSVNQSPIACLDKDLDHVEIKIETSDFCFYHFSLNAPPNSLKKETILSYIKHGPDLFLLGDLNSRSPSLGCRALESDSNGKILEEILSSDIDFVVLNDESSTYFRYKIDFRLNVEL
jgi:hypothetical protein